MEINGNTEIFGVIGKSISYTLSPRIHNYLFKKFNLNAVYICFNVDFKKDDFFYFLKSLSKSYNFKGLNVTIPYKKFAWEFSENCYKDLKAINTLKFENGKILGENTDIYGFRKAIVEKLKFNPQGKNFLIYGAGDTARTIIFSILNDCNQIFLINRTLNNAIKLKKEYNSDKIFLGKPQDYTLIDIVINATPVDLTIDYEKFKKDCCFFDVKYINSKFISEAKKRKFKAINGIWMLIFQGIKSFEYWTGKEIKEGIVNNIYRRLK